VASKTETRERRHTASGQSKRKLLVARAAQLFDEDGYHSTSVEDVAEACGIRKPTLYHYFKSKEEILYGIHDEFIDMLIAREKARRKLELSAGQELFEVMGDFLDLLATHRGHVRVFFEHYRELADRQKAAIKRKRDRYESSVRAIFEAGVASGEFRDVDPRMSMLALAGMCNWAYHWYVPDQPLTGRQVAFTFWDLLVRGLQAPPAAAAPARRARRTAS
jgi:AcrR family transcriptional regulator